MLTTDVTHDGGEGVVSWSYSVDNADIQDLAAGQTLTQVYTLTLTTATAAPPRRDDHGDGHQRRAGGSG